MPRNRHKTPCQVPHCRNWAMRGHTRCRSHRDRELGPRGEGAPPANLNALRTGDHARPLPPGGHERLALRLAREPERLPDHLHPAIQSIHRRTGDPAKTLVALRALCARLLPLVAAQRSAADLDALRHGAPALDRAAIQAAVEGHARRLPPEDRLVYLRHLLENDS